MEALQELVVAGKIRYFGLSNETAWGLMKWLQLAERHNLPRPVSIQNEYSLICRHFEPDLSEIAIHEDCGLLAWSPLAFGLLSGKYSEGRRPKGARLSDFDRFEYRLHENAHLAVKDFLDIVNGYGLESTQVALAFVNDRPFVCSTLIGATNMAQLKSNIESVNLKIPAELASEIIDLRRDHPMPF